MFAAKISCLINEFLTRDFSSKFDDASPIIGVFITTHRHESNIFAKGTRSVTKEKSKQIVNNNVCLSSV